MDNLSKIISDSISQNSVGAKESIYRQNLPKSSQQQQHTSSSNTRGSSSIGGLPFLLATGENSTLGAGNEEFEIEEDLEEGKLVLYITEKQLLQLLRQRAVIAQNKKKLFIDEKSDGKKIFLVDQTSDGSVNQTLVWQQQTQPQQQQQQQQQRNQQQQQQHQVTNNYQSGTGRTSPYKYVDVFVKTNDAQKVPLPNILNQDTNNYKEVSFNETLNKYTFSENVPIIDVAGIRPSNITTEVRKTVISPSEFETIRLQHQENKKDAKSNEISSQYAATFNTKPHNQPGLHVSEFIPQDLLNNVVISQINRDKPTEKQTVNQINTNTFVNLPTNGTTIDQKTNQSVDIDLLNYLKQRYETSAIVNQDTYATSTKTEVNRTDQTTNAKHQYYEQFGGQLSGEILSGSQVTGSQTHSYSHPISQNTNNDQFGAKITEAPISGIQTSSLGTQSFGFNYPSASSAQNVIVDQFTSQISGGKISEAQTSGSQTHSYYHQVNQPSLNDQFGVKITDAPISGIQASSSSTQSYGFNYPSASSAQNIIADQFTSQISGGKISETQTSGLQTHSYYHQVNQPSLNDQFVTQRTEVPISGIQTSSSGTQSYGINYPSASAAQNVIADQFTSQISGGKISETQTSGLQTHSYSHLVKQPSLNDQFGAKITEAPISGNQASSSSTQSYGINYPSASSVQNVIADQFISQISGGKISEAQTFGSQTHSYYHQVNQPSLNDQFGAQRTDAPISGIQASSSSTQSFGFNYPAAQNIIIDQATSQTSKGRTSEAQTSGSQTHSYYHLVNQPSLNDQFGAKITEAPISGIQTSSSSTQSYGFNYPSASSAQNVIVDQFISQISGGKASQAQTSGSQTHSYSLPVNQISLSDQYGAQISGNQFTSSGSQLPSLPQSEGFSYSSIQNLPSSQVSGSIQSQNQTINLVEQYNKKQETLTFTPENSFPSTIKNQQISDNNSFIASDLTKYLYIPSSGQQTISSNVAVDNNAKAEFFNLKDQVNVSQQPNYSISTNYPFQDKDKVSSAPSEAYFQNFTKPLDSSVNTHTSSDTVSSTYNRKGNIVYYDNNNF